MFKQSQDKAWLWSRRRDNSLSGMAKKPMPECKTHFLLACLTLDSSQKNRQWLSWQSASNMDHAPPQEHTCKAGFWRVCPGLDSEYCSVLEAAKRPKRQSTSVINIATRQPYKARLPKVVIQILLIVSEATKPELQSHYWTTRITCKECLSLMCKLSYCCPVQQRV